MEVDHREERSIRTYRSGSGTHDVSDVLGSGGTSYTGERLRWSAFGELRLPLHRDWTVALAARHDRYDDVGPAWSYQVASVYRLHKVLSLRGSWETGRTPAALGDLHASESLFYPRICDSKTFTGPRADCPRTQVEAVTRGNPELEPDRRQTYTFGAKAILGKLSVSVDWFRIEASDTPGQLSTQKIVDIEAAGGSLPAGAAVIREGNLITRIVNPLVNSGESEVSGLDIRAGARWKIRRARFRLRSALAAPARIRGLGRRNRAARRFPAQPHPRHAERGSGPAQRAAGSSAGTSARSPNIRTATAAGASRRGSATISGWTGATPLVSRT